MSESKINKNFVEAVHKWRDGKAASAALPIVAWQHWGDQTRLLCDLGKQRAIPGTVADEFTRSLTYLDDAQALIAELWAENERLTGKIETMRRKNNELNEQYATALTQLQAASAEREAFEVMCDRKGYVKTRHLLGDDYKDATLQRMWEAWQARAALSPAEQPAKPFKLRLCEQNKTVLKPDTAYLFTVDPECPACLRIAALHAQPLGGEA